MADSARLWLDRLEPRLDARWVNRMGIDDAYFEGDHPLAFATGQYNEAFGGLLKPLADNWMQIIVSAAVERMEVQGFRFGKEQGADELAWDIWQANNLDAESRLLHTEAVKLGEAYWQVTPPATSDDPPLVTAEDPSQMIVACAPGNRRKRLAALKKWQGDDGYAYATVFLPEGIAKFRSAKPLRDTGAKADGRIVWSAGNWLPNPLGEVPVIPFYNDPGLRTGGRSDLTAYRSDQDVINKILADLMIGAEYQSFPQRVLLGVEVPKDPATGEPIRAAELQASRSRLWVFENENAEIAEFNAADLAHYVATRGHLIQGLMAKARIPPYYTAGQIVNASGDSLQIADNNLVAKVRPKLTFAGEAHEDMERLSFKALGDMERAKSWNAETIWKNPEIRSQAQVTDAVIKEHAAGLIPQEVALEKLGYSPQEVDRIMATKAVDDLLAPPPPEPPPVVPDASAA